MNEQDFEAAKATARRERRLPVEMYSLLTPEQDEEIWRIFREEVGYIHVEAPPARLIYERPPKEPPQK